MKIERWFLSLLMAVGFACAGMLLLGILLLAQDKPAASDGEPPNAKAEATSPAATTPKINDAVALEVRNAEWEMAKVALQIQQDQQAVAAGQQAQKDLQELMRKNQQLQMKYQAVVAGALKKSNIDPEKWDLNPDTMTVTPKAAAVPAPAAPKPPTPPSAPK